MASSKGKHVGDEVFEKAEPSVSDLHTNRPLTDVSVSYAQEEDTFVATRAFATVMSPKKSNEYFIFDEGDFHRDEAQERGPGTESEGNGYALSKDNFSCVRYSYHKDIPSEDIENEDEAAETEIVSTEFVTQKGLIKRERIVADAFFKTGVWATDITGVDANPGAGQTLKWNKAGSTPFDDVEAGRVKIRKDTGRRGQVIVCGVDAFRVLKNHADVIDRTKHTSRDSITPQMMAALFQVDEFIVAESVYNTAKKGQTASNDFIWDTKSMLLMHKAPSASRRRPSSGYIFVWNGYYGGERGLRIKRLEMPLRDSTRIEMDIAFTPKVVGRKLGYFWSNIVDAT